MHCLREKPPLHPPLGGVAVVQGDIDTIYYPNGCKRVSSIAEIQARGTRLNNLLPLLKGSPVFLCREEAEQTMGQMI